MPNPLLGLIVALNRSSIQEHFYLIVVGGDLRLETSEDDVPANTIKTLDAVPFTYADGSLIFGIKAFDGSVLEVILQDGMLIL